MRGFLRLVLYLVTIALGLFLAAVDQRPDLIERVAAAAHTTQGQWIIRAAAATLLSSPLIILLRWFQSIRRNREISYETDNGMISVSLIAIEEALTRAVEGEPEVKKAHVKVFEDRVRRGIVIEAVITLWEVPNVTDRNRFCQRLLRRRFAELMPEQSQVDVNLHLHRLTERRIDPKVDRQAAPARNATSDDRRGTDAGEAGMSSGHKVAVTAAHRRNSGINPVAAALPNEPSDEDLYVGPSYPVDAMGMGDEDDEPQPPGRLRR